MKHSMFFLIGLFAITATGASHAQKIVQNGGFESGLAGWTVNTQLNDDYWRIATGVSGGAGPNTGSLLVETGCAGTDCLSYGTPSANDLSQDLSTTIGASYTLSFHVTEPNSGPSELDVYWGGHEVFAQQPITFNVDAYTDYTVTGLVASSVSTKLEFLASQSQGYFGMDDISLVANSTVGPVPEPSTYALIAAGLGVLGWASRRRRGV